MRTRTLAATIATASALTLCPPTMAQTDGGDGERHAGHDGMAALLPDIKHLVRSERHAGHDGMVTLDFPGGSLADFVAHAREASGDRPVNILYPPEFGELELPPVELERVHLSTALRVLQNIGEHRPMRMPDGREAGWEVDIIGGGSGAPVYSILVWADEDEHWEEEEEHEEEPERFTIVQSLASLIAGEHALGADAVLSSIQVALEMTGQGEADLRFHEDTALLFARVTGEQEEAIDDAVDRLNQSALHLRRAQDSSQINRLLEALGVESQQAAKRVIDEAHEAQRRWQDQQGEVEELKRMLASENRMRNRDRQRFESEFNTLNAELERMRGRVEALERENKRLEIERDALAGELEALRAARRRPQE